MSGVWVVRFCVLQVDVCKRCGCVLFCFWDGCCVWFEVV